MSGNMRLGIIIIIKIRNGGALRDGASYYGDVMVNSDQINGGDLWMGINFMGGVLWMHLDPIFLRWIMGIGI